ncbi:vWA domain-containing protein [Tautonia sociabilis]|uniref:VWA domain-containing protein n=1 Tax=Tautonia sociabilis TaxID=2080755 RepID=A0A432MEF3_9BACT|nr:vWA domain-containing protein [Tautonia sociabilis]RUL83784.1 VWA domain-containing protein [Tautonia sociabilis]
MPTPRPWLSPPSSAILPVPLVLPLLLMLPAASALADDPKPRPAPEPPAPDPAVEAPAPEPAGQSQDAGETEAPSDRPRRVGPVVRSAEEAAALLRDPSEDPYEEAIDWRTVPPWQQTSFYGLRARGTFFVFVVDCSGSMADDLRLIRAKQELRRSIGAMRFPQRHLVIFYNDRPIPMAGGVPRSAEQRDKQATFSWLGSIDAEGGTDPRGALNLAVGLRPDAVFLLSDGEFPPGTVDGISKFNGGRVPIHCIDLAGGGGAEQLRAIATTSGGRYLLRR